MAQKVNLGPYKAGDDTDIGLTFEKDDGTAYDITSWKVFFTVKSSRGQADSEAIVSKTITNHEAPTSGETAVTLTADETSDLSSVYVYDVQVKKGDNTIQTPIEGQIEFEQDVTRRTS